MAEPTDLDEAFAAEPETCPQCGSVLMWGYGLAAGGIGQYVICTGRACPFIEKRSEDDGSK